MDLPTSPTTPLGPMTRARAKAIEDKVNSPLSKIPLSMHETWLLPQAETLCVIRYLEESHGSAIPNRQDGEDTKLHGQEEGLLETPMHWTTGEPRTSETWGGDFWACARFAAQQSDSREKSVDRKTVSHRTSENHRTTDGKGFGR